MLLATFKHISSKNADYSAAEAYLTFAEAEVHEGFAEEWYADVTVVWGYVEPEAESESDE